MSHPGRNPDVGSPTVSEQKASTASDPGKGTEPAALLAAWATGWAISRGFPAPDLSGPGLWVRPGEAGRERELVWPRPDAPIEPDLLASIGASATPTWVTVATHDVSQTQGLLSEQGVVPAGWPEWLMTRDLKPADDAPCPAGFTCTIETDGSLIRAAARTEAGRIACSGQLALTSDGAAVADRIVTEEGYRRRGLGRHLMGRLTAAAVSSGATTGVLIASAEGFGLYTALRWTAVCDVVVARNTSAMA